jgi:hypothetical protein
VFGKGLFSWTSLGLDVNDRDHKTGSERSRSSGHLVHERKHDDSVSGILDRFYDFSELIKINWRYDVAIYDVVSAVERVRMLTELGIEIQSFA